jgi:hypothetical protein
MPKTAPLKPKAKHKGGRPSKKTPATLERALAAAREGLPSRFCAGLAGISYQSLNEYRKADPDFAQRYETALSEGVQAKFRKILEAGNRETPGSWQALAWALERGYSSEFARPEIQLNQINNSQTNVNTGIVITAEVADKLQRRNAAIEKEIDGLMKAHEAKRGLASVTGRDQIREVEAELMSSAAITLPPPSERHPSWWAMLSRGDGHRPITPEAAKYIVQAVATDTLGAARASGLRIDLDGGDLSLSDVWAAVQSFGGWLALVKRGEP